MTWNDQSDAKVSRPAPSNISTSLTISNQLLVAILHTTSAKLDYAAIAKYMGPGTPSQSLPSQAETNAPFTIECTKIAVQTRLTRLKKQVHDASNPAAAGAGNEGSTPVTPEKRKKGAKASSKSKDEDVLKRPTKKAKSEEDKEDMETETEESG
jgi:hypothetical protein